MNRTNARRASASLKILPPMIFGTITYQQMYAGISQKYTSGWPKYQKSVRLKSTLIFSTQPKDQGMNWNSTVAATPSVATYHSTIVATAMKANSGEILPLLFFRHAPYCAIMPAPLSQLPTTTRVKAT